MKTSKESHWLYISAAKRLEYYKQPPQVFCKKDVLKNFAIFTEHLCWNLSLIKLLQAAAFKAEVLLKRGSSTGAFL